MTDLLKKYRDRLTSNANDFDQIVIDMCNEACKHKLEAERWRLQHKDVLASCNDISRTFAAYRESSAKIIASLKSETPRVERDALAQILEELLFLKYLKNAKGKTPAYLKRQPLAWIAANQVLTTLED